MQMNALGTKSTLMINGHDLAFHRKGSGRTMLLVHGITTYSFIWRGLVDALSQSFDVISIDLMGCGESDKPLDISYSLKHHAVMLDEFTGRLNIQKFYFIGHDVGGGIGQIFSVRYPEKLYSLVLINSVAYDFWPVQPIIAMRTPIIRQLAMASLDMGTFKLVVQRGVYHRERVTEALMDHFCKPMKTSQGRKAFLHFAKCLDKRDLMEIADDLQKLSLPTLIIRGDADIYLSASICEKLHDEIQTSTLVRIARAGHFIQEDAPEELVRHIQTFLAGLP